MWNFQNRVFQSDKRNKYGLLAFKNIYIKAKKAKKTPLSPGQGKAASFAWFSPVPPMNSTSKEGKNASFLIVYLSLRILQTPMDLHGSHSM
jgi:hypothetical protein